MAAQVRDALRGDGAGFALEERTDQTENRAEKSAQIDHQAHHDLRLHLSMKSLFIRLGIAR
ncbi:hypothetical protein J4573_40460 [Actinomadura barringtoniae]|uniref:Uncharacterized protein n=1 Tax=Actinomadura barringtoniae TaxID=1427535 RepID=A0A939PJG8_9ACTN|nr:hypothetical protein [Actinomadura barringtoniae]MBO2453422.1 hypothetical protein [Actinomadura barringtoniae]